MKLSLIKPVSAMFATMLMCGILSVSHSLRAQNIAETSTQIQILSDKDVEQTRFIVDGQYYSWGDLSLEQQTQYKKLRSRLLFIEGKLAQLERRAQPIEADINRQENRLHRVVDQLVSELEIESLRLELLLNRLPK